MVGRWQVEAVLYGRYIGIPSTVQMGKLSTKEVT